jgi:hypothetical protein
MSVCILECIAKATDEEITLMLFVVAIWLLVAAAIWAGRQRH